MKIGGNCYMNNFQKERKKILPAKGLSEDKKRAVIQAVHSPERKQKKWLPAVTVGGVIAASSFLLFTEQEQQQPITSETEQEQTNESFAEGFIKDNHMKNPEILYEQHNIAPNVDEFIIVKDIIEGETLYHIASGHYNEQQQRWWTDERIFLYEEFPIKVTNFSMNNAHLKIGLIQDEQIEAIYVGDEQATIVEDSAGQRIWFYFEDSIHKPVFEVIDGKKSRIAGAPNRQQDSVIPIIEPIKEHLQTVHYEENTMHRGNEEYSKFPIVIDPYYYAEQQFKVGDVIAYHIDGKLQIGRILGTDASKVSLTEDTLVNEKNIQQMAGLFYTWPTYDGDTGIYKGLSKDFDIPTIDELLVIPDNWASDGYQGIIKKEQLVGAVVGYDLTQLTNTLTNEELKLFNKLQKQQNNRAQLLKQATVNEVVRMYLYANYVGDYELMYALLEQNEALPPYNKWLQQVQKVSKNHLLKDIYHMGFAQLTKDESKLRFTDPVSENIIKQYEVAKTKDGWKVKYSTVSGNRN